MNYTEYKIKFPATSPSEIGEIAVAMLADMGFDSFDDNGEELLCYIEEHQLKTNATEIADYVKELKEDGVEITISEIETVNWNKEWESNFDPIEIDDLCTIRAPFHEKNSTIEHDIIIMPKMSFGTGHHATTYLMTKTIFSLEISGKKGLDMGSGTGVLAIAALKAGAASVDCVDIDDWAVENCKENLAANGCEGCGEVILGDATSLEGKKYDFILANINRNILIADMDRYDATLSSGGLLQMSGFLEIDLDDIVDKAKSLGYTLKSSQNRDSWCVVVLEKQ